MDLANILKELWRQKIFVVLALIPAIYLGLSSAYDVSLNPPELRERTFQAGAAQTQMLVDRRRSSIAAVPPVTQGDPLTNESLTRRTATLARVIPSNEILEDVARRLDIEPTQLVATPPSEPAQAGAQRQTQAEDRASNIVAEGGQYRLLISNSSFAPVITLNAQAPTAEEAVRLAEGTVRATQLYLRRLQRESRVPVRSSRRIVVQQLGTVDGGTITEAPNRSVALATGLGAWVLLVLVILAIAPALRRLRLERRTNRVARTAAVEAE